MARILGSPLSLLLAGWIWLLLSALLGWATFLGIVRGAPLPYGFRLLHVHGALVGGLLQLLLGLALTVVELSGPDSKRPKQPGLFLGLNLAVLALAVGTWLRQPNLTLPAGLGLLFLFAPVTRRLFLALATRPDRTPLVTFFFGFACAGLFGSLVLGELLAGGWVPIEHGRLRLGHIHGSLLIFFTLAVVGSLQLALPALLHQPLYSARLGQVALLLLPACVAGLLTGFLLSSIPIQLVAGGFLVATLALYAANLFLTWKQAGQPGSAGSDHLMTAVFFLLLFTILGIAVGINSLWTPPAMPYGTLHLVAYTHSGFLGLFVQAMVGALSYALPALLAAQRVVSHKKRSVYHERLAHTMDRWRAVQVAGLSFGTLGLVLVASVIWNVPLSSPWVQSLTWISLSLLLGHITLVTMKIVQVVGTYPTSERDHKGA
ncbi:MAG: hypothetical protein L6Q34_05190 [Nitrospira sp.]|nr:MAG: hypothetical protein UZ03_NOB001001359 [Nitrospira sp. OLB3]MCE7964002.1 hypothetical protein [Nitrospira sp. NTP2]MCK6492806.1 hypothetical protein [Nitrospira sp.]MCK6499420.1 hypothetical protein [Nitrospira sp.]RIK56326.1 MAG: hypothetical protein DCC63_17560 [Nitrospira sp.]